MRAARWSAGRGRRGSAGAFTANATLIRRVDLTPSVARFVVLRDAPAAPHLAGHYLAVGLWVDGRLLQRPYSTASPPRASRELEFLIRRVPHGSLTPRLWELPRGARLRVGPPKGLLALDPRRDRAAVFAATGTGLAPFISMLAAVLAGPVEARPPRIIVLHGVSYAAELAYRDRLANWSATHAGLIYEPVISRPGDPRNAGWSGAVGHLDVALDAAWQRHRLGARETVTYLCGNPEAITSVARRLAAPRCASRCHRGGALLDGAEHGTFSTRPSGLTTPSIGSMRLLLVEDEPRMAALVRRVLTAEHHVVDVAADGVSALAFTDGPAYDVVILDRMLPDLDGIEVLRLMRARGVRAAVVLLTALGSVEERVAGLDAGADDYLAKPFAFSELLARVRALGRARHRRPRAASGRATLSSTNRVTWHVSASRSSTSRPANSPCWAICCATAVRS